MGNIPHKDLQIIENILETSTTQFETQMKEEYYLLKNSQLPKDRNPIIDSPTIRSITIPIKPKKRLARFYKWFKMIFVDNDEESLSKTPLGTSIIINKENIIKTQSTLSKTRPSFHFRNRSSKSVESDIIPIKYQKRANNFYEINLRRYYLNNQEHFLSRASKGPPDSLRWLAWMILLNTPTGRSESIYIQLTSEDIESKIDTQIKKDVNRTISEITIPICSDKLNEAKNGLYRLLKALACCDKELGYCQGINFITGYLLLASGFNETEAFYLLIALFSKTFHSGFNIRGFFVDDFPMLNCFLYVFDILLSREMPELHKHLETINIPYEVWLGKWIQTLYTLCLPYELNLRLWDHFLSYGIDFILLFSISLVKEIEKDLQAIKDAFDYSDYFKNLFATISNEKIDKQTSSSSNDNIKISLFERILKNATKFFKIHKILIMELKTEFELKNKHSKVNVSYNLTLKIENHHHLTFDLDSNQRVRHNSLIPKSQTTNLSRGSINNLNYNCLNYDEELYQKEDEVCDECVEIANGKSIEDYKIDTHKSK